MDFVVGHDSFGQVAVLGVVGVFGAVEFNGEFELMIEEFLELGVFEFELFFSFIGLLLDLLFGKDAVDLLVDVGWWDGGFGGLTEAIES